MFFQSQHILLYVTLLYSTHQLYDALSASHLYALFYYLLYSSPQNNDDCQYLVKFQHDFVSVLSRKFVPHFYISVK